MELLLLSNSRTENGWLVDHVPAIREIAAGRKRAFFIPYAVVGTPWEEITGKLFDVLDFLSPVEEVENAELVVVSGGNTFQLLGEVRRRRLLEPIRKRVRSGAMRYVRTRPAFSEITKPPDSNTARCFTTEGNAIVRGRASSDTDAGPALRRSIMPRRLVSASAWNI